jgi:hypothetical protein
MYFKIWLIYFSYLCLRQSIVTYFLWDGYEPVFHTTSEMKISHSKVKKLEVLGIKNGFGLFQGILKHHYACWQQQYQLLHVTFLIQFNHQQCSTSTTSSRLRLYVLYVTSKIFLAHPYQANHSPKTHYHSSSTVGGEYHHLLQDQAGAVTVDHFVESECLNCCDIATILCINRIQVFLAMNKTR